MCYFLITPHTLPCPRVIEKCPCFVPMGSCSGQWLILSCSTHCARACVFVKVISSRYYSQTTCPYYHPKTWILEVKGILVVTHELTPNSTRSGLTQGNVPHMYSVFLSKQSLHYPWNTDWEVKIKKSIRMWILNRYLCCYWGWIFSNLRRGVVTHVYSGPLSTKKWPFYWYRGPYYKPEAVVRPS